MLTASVQSKGRFGMHFSIEKKTILMLQIQTGRLNSEI